MKLEMNFEVCVQGLDTEEHAFQVWGGDGEDLSLAMSHVEAC